MGNFTVRVELHHAQWNDYDQLHAAMEQKGFSRRIMKFYQLLGGGLKDAGWQREHMSQNRLAILPNLTHYEMGLAPQMVDAALPFLNGEGRAKSWDEQVSAK